VNAIFFNGAIQIGFRFEKGKSVGFLGVRETPQKSSMKTTRYEARVPSP
jgi:hypothetical protein